MTVAAPHSATVIDNDRGSGRGEIAGWDIAATVARQSSGAGGGQRSSVAEGLVRSGGVKRRIRLSAA
jgi:hypothetical protein